MADLDALRSKLWHVLRNEYALFAPAGSTATPQGDEPPVGSPERTKTRARQLLMVGSESSNRLMMGADKSLLQRQQFGMGLVPTIRQRRGLSQLWIDTLEKMPITAVPPQIRKSLYQQLTHRVGLYPMNDMWYPIGENANTKNDLRWAVQRPPVQIPGSTPQGVSMSPRPQFRRAWRVPRYSTQPDVVVPEGRYNKSAPGGGIAP